MNGLITARQDLADALGTEDYPALDHVPEDIVPPCTIVQGGDPYAVPCEETFDSGEYDVTLELFLLVDLQTNDQAVDDLDQLLDHVLTALPRQTWAIDRVGAPQPFHTANWLAHGIQITVSTTTTLAPTGEQA